MCSASALAVFTVEDFGLVSSAADGLNVTFVYPVVSYAPLIAGSGFKLADLFSAFIAASLFFSR